MCYLYRDALSWIFNLIQIKGGTMNFYRVNKNFLRIIFILILTNSCHIAEQKTGKDSRKDATVPIYYPARDLGILYEDVQLSGIFSDSKTFADSDPLFSPEKILKWYEKERKKPDFSLEAFIDSCFHFQIAEMPDHETSVQPDISKYLHSHWDALSRSDTASEGGLSTRIRLMFPYVVPGGRFREIYYWDSYFTMEGLAASDRFELVVNMTENFNSLIHEYGYVPNGSRTYYLSRSQPPFFAEMVKLVMRLKGDSAGLKYLPALKREYSFWMDSNGETVYRRTVKAGKVTLNRYWDDDPEPRTESFKEDYLAAKGFSVEKKRQYYRNVRAACESGWDFSSRWLKDRKDPASIETTNILPVDLNCLIYNMEELISRLYLLKPNADSAAIFAGLAEDRKCIIQDLFWNQEAGFFFDYNISEQKLMEVHSLAGVFPLYFGIATDDQADKLANQLNKLFFHEGGLTATMIDTGEQWDKPNGWAPLHWIAICGLEKYGFEGFATVIAQRWLNLNKKVYLRSGKMLERYNVVDPEVPGGGGEYPLQDGFGWTNGVYLGLLAKGYHP
jgi:alpha,alpha-trehalase